MNPLQTVNREHGLALVRKPLQRAAQTVHTMQRQEVREGSTGRVVGVPATSGLALVPRPVRLQRVWAVGEDAVQPAVPSHAATKERSEQPVELAFYRKYTEAMLQRYLRMAMSAGRVPSLMGREMFRGQVSSCRVHSFEDVVIFCFDMEKLIARLEPMDKQLIKRIALQRYTQGEAAMLLGVSLRNSIRLYAAALDRLTAMLLEARMLEVQTSCQ